MRRMRRRRRRRMRRSRPKSVFASGLYRTHLDPEAPMQGPPPCAGRWETFRGGLVGPQKAPAQKKPKNTDKHVFDTIKPLVSITNIKRMNYDECQKNVDAFYSGLQATFWLLRLGSCMGDVGDQRCELRLERIGGS
eukprot:8858782-Pyramimonas_sp.AAC.1